MKSTLITVPNIVNRGRISPGDLSPKNSMNLVTAADLFKLCPLSRSKITA